MKSVLSVLALVCAVLTAPLVHAADKEEAWAWAPGEWPTPKDALQHNVAAPPGCFDAAGGNVCAPIAVAMDGPGVLIWGSGWIEKDRVVCIDEATAEVRVACTDPDAVPSHDPRMTMCSRGANGEDLGCQLMPSHLRERMPTPKEALRHPPEVPWECRETGKNLCDLVIERSGPGWASDWAPHEEVVCVDQPASGKRQACNAPGAWRVRRPVSAEGGR